MFILYHIETHECSTSKRWDDCLGSVLELCISEFEAPKLSAQRKEPVKAHHEYREVVDATLI